MRNIPKVKAVDWQRVNTHDVLNYKWLVVSRQAFDVPDGEIEVSKDPYQIILRPVITEKSTVLKDQNRDVCFEVALHANKTEIKKAVEHLFKVKVENVRTQIKHGKERRVGRSSGHDQDLEEGPRPAQSRRENDRIFRGGLTWASKPTDHARRACATAPA